MKFTTVIGGAMILLAQAVLSASTPPAGNSAAPAAPPLTVTAPNDKFPVSMTVSVDLHALHPMAQKAALHCGAVASSYAAARNNLQVLQNNWTNQPSAAVLDKFNQLVLFPAHYNSADVSVDIPLANRGYSGMQTITLQVPSATLIDPLQHAVFPTPGILVGCWLLINGVPALQVSGVEIATAKNVNHVSQQPFFAAAQEVPAL